MPSWFQDVFYIVLAIVLLFVNGFFVAAEFALVKVRPSQLDVMVREQRPFAKTAVWLLDRLDGTLGACQLGITIGSLGLGWIGEPAVARLLEPLIHAVGVTSPTVIHGVSFAIAFTTITAGHLVVGELAPKTLAIRRPERIALACAGPLKAFYVVFYPFFGVLNNASMALVSLLGVQPPRGHGDDHSEEELRALLSQAHGRGELTRSEHELLNAVFEFDDVVCRRVMLPRGDVAYLDVNAPLSDSFAIIARTKHTRYPLCDGSLDAVLGVVHIKDLLGVSPDADAEILRRVMRPPHHVPESLPVSRLLRYFQAVRQLMAFVVDEYGTVIGIVTLENVVELIVGRVEDEFDTETPEIVPAGSGQFLVLGGTPVEVVDEKLGLDLEAGSEDVDTLSGLVVARLGQIPEVGNSVELEGATAEVVEVKGSRARQIRLTLHEASEEPGDEAVESDPANGNVDGDDSSTI